LPANYGLTRVFFTENGDFRYRSIKGLGTNFTG